MNITRANVAAYRASYYERLAMARTARLAGQMETWRWATESARAIRLAMGAVS